MELTDINVIKALADRHGFRFSKSLGQNFLTSRETVEKIAESSRQNGAENCIEVGPGFGVLTKELCLRYKNVTAVEIDKSLLPVLKDTVSEFENLKIINADILKTDISALIGSFEGGVNIAANLPYYITTPVITALLEKGRNALSMTFMVQKEVAERLTAPPGSALCGAISYFVSYYANAEYLFEVARENFVPAPKVTSAVIRLTPKKPDIEVKNEALMFSLIKAAFSCRRKTLVNALSTALPAHTKEEYAAAVEKAGLPPDIRGERLTLENFAAMANIL